MEDRLKNLRKSMEKTTFNQLKFTEQQRKDIREKINKQNESEEDILLAIMQLLVLEKTGFELAKYLRSRGIQKFENNEGLLYTLLHRLEQSGCLQSNWDESAAKHYKLNDKGRKILRKAEKKQTKKRFVLTELLEG
ncbi:PadR family transcriptional regulator [Lederbergia citrea]|uniref:PadR family transcriptional regulator n=1 Tax=Lederbergia citrea TaxID=2833581 RepID=A0A942Z646_9BACI|nr:PadR family transcriptional regulator [Lederbergia citrea]MBS4177875.1 PadR family transcriptional regulator [Lederbergia citrea]MBS4223606.1 PadR family transcriptional regulator [Lederbergia citrea]